MRIVIPLLAAALALALVVAVFVINEPNPDAGPVGDAAGTQQADTTAETQPEGDTPSATSSPAPSPDADAAD